jgi:hypothetical protein
LAALFGDSELISNITDLPTEASRNITVRRLGDRDVIGTSCLATSPAGAIELFMGIDAEVRGILSTDKNAEKIVTVGLAAHKAFNEIDHGVASAPDGAVLSVSVNRA